MDLSAYKRISINGIPMKKITLGGVVAWKRPAINQVPLSIDTDGSIFNGKGYIEGYRLSSSGGLSAQEGVITTGFIPCKPTDLIRMAGVAWISGNKTTYLAFYDANKALLGSLNCYINASYASGYVSTTRGIVKHKTTNAVGNADNHPSVDANGVITFDQYGFTDGSKVAYFRINGIGNGADMVVTVNEEIG